MGKVSKYSNLYDQNGVLLRHVDEKGILRDYTLEELESYTATLDPSTLAYRNCTSVLIEWYQHPRTKEDQAYVQKKQQELLDKLKKQAEENKKKNPDSVKQALEETNKELDNMLIGEDPNESDREQSGTDTAEV